MFATSREPDDDDGEQPEADVAAGYMGDQNAWCYWDAEYPDEGSCGPYATREEAAQAARDAGYRVEQ